MRRPTPRRAPAAGPSTTKGAVRRVLPRRTVRSLQGTTPSPLDRHRERGTTPATPVSVTNRPKNRVSGHTVLDVTAPPCDDNGPRPTSTSSRLRLPAGRSHDQVQGPLDAPLLPLATLPPRPHVRADLTGAHLLDVYVSRARGRGPPPTRQRYLPQLRDRVGRSWIPR